MPDATPASIFRQPADLGAAPPVPRSRPRDPPPPARGRGDPAFPGAQLGRRPPPPSGRALHLDGRGEAGVPEDPRRVLRREALAARSVQPRRGLLRLRNAADGRGQGDRTALRPARLRRDLPDRPGALGRVRPADGVARLSAGAALHAPSGRALLGRAVELLRPRDSALPLLGGRHVSRDVHGGGSPRVGAHRAGADELRRLRGDRPRHRPRRRMQDHRTRAAGAARRRGARLGNPADDPIRSHPLLRRAPRPPRTLCRRRSRAALPAPHLPRPEPLLAQARPAVDRRSEAPAGALLLGRGLPAGAAVGGPHDPLPDREPRPLGRRRLLRRRGARRPRLGLRRRRAPAGVRPRAALRPRALPSGVPRRHAGQVDPLPVPRLPRARRPDRGDVLEAPARVPLSAPRPRGRGRGRRRHRAVGGRLHRDLPAPAVARGRHAVDLRARPRAAAHRQRVLGRRPAPADAGLRPGRLRRAAVPADVRSRFAGEGRDPRAGAERRELGRGDLEPRLRERHARPRRLPDVDRVLPGALRRAARLRPRRRRHVVPHARSPAHSRRPRPRSSSPCTTIRGCSSSGRRSGTRRPRPGGSSSPRSRRRRRR